MTISTSGYGQTDRPTDIATYRAAIAAKNTEKNKISENKKSYKKDYQFM